MDRLEHDSLGLQKEIFTSAAKQIKMHPFLTKTASGHLHKEIWATYIDNRLGAGESFVEFLRALIQEAKRHGYTDLQNVLEGNLAEELGMVNDQIVIAQSHAEWRRWFREEMEHLLPKNTIILPEASEYSNTLRSLAERADFFEMIGALTALELLIATEYIQILQGLDINFSHQISARGMTYIRSHAYHDHRHFDELVNPLQVICQTPVAINSVIQGVKHALQSKIEFLNGMECINTKA